MVRKFSTEKKLQKQNQKEKTLKNLRNNNEYKKSMKLINIKNHEPAKLITQRNIKKKEAKAKERAQDFVRAHFPMIIIQKLTS